MYMVSTLDFPIQDVTVTMSLLRIGAAWSRLLGRFTCNFSTIGISARGPVIKPISVQCKDIFEHCPLEISQAPRPDLAISNDLKPLQTPLQLMPILAVHIAVVYGSVTHDAIISTLYVVVFAHLSGTTNQIKRIILESSLWLVLEARMRTGRLEPKYDSFKGTSKIEGRSLPFLVMSPPHTGKSRMSSQADSYRLSTPRMYSKRRMIQLFLSFSTLMKVSKAAPIIFRDETSPCQFTTGDPPNDCQIGTSASLTPGAQALIASCVLVALLVFLIVVFGLPQAMKDLALVIWNAYLPGFNRERWHSGREHPNLGEQVVQNSITVEATEGITGNDMLSPENPKVRVHWKRPLSWFWLFRMPQLPLQSEGQDHGDGRIPSSDIADERDKVILRMGAVFESATMERPLELHDLDLIHSSQDRDHELEELPATTLGTSDRQDQS